MRTEQAEAEICCQVPIPEDSEALSKLLSEKSENVLISMCHLATKCKEKKSENNTLGAHLLSSASHAASHNELRQKDQVSGNRLPGKELLLHGQGELEGGRLNSQLNMPAENWRTERAALQ